MRIPAVSIPAPTAARPIHFSRLTHKLQAGSLRRYRPRASLNESTERTPQRSSGAGNQELQPLTIKGGALERKATPHHLDSSATLHHYVQQYFSQSNFDKALDACQVHSCLQQVRQLVRALEDFGIGEAGSDCREGSNSLQTSLWAKQYVSDLLRKRHQRLLRLCVRKGNLEAALDYVRLLPARADVFSSLMKESLVAGGLSAVARVVQVRKEMGLPPDAYSYTALLSAAGKEGNQVALQSIFDEAWAKDIRDVSLFNTLITAHNNKYDSQAAFAVFANMEELGIKPDAITINGLIRAAGAQGRLDKVQELFARMCDVGPAPTKHTFGHIFSAFHDCKRKDVDWLFQVYEAMGMLGVAPNPVLIGSFLRATWNLPLTGQQSLRVYGIGKDFCSSESGDASVYTALLTFCRRQSMPEKAADVWAVLTKEGHRPDHFVFTALFSACAAYSSQELLHLASQGHAALEAHWQHLRSTKAVSLPIQKGMTVAYNALLNAYARGGKMFSMHAVFESMQRQGPAPDLISYNTIINGFAQAADADSAFKVFQALCEAEMKPQVKTFGALLHACARSANAYSAKRVMELMRGAGVKPSVEAYTSLMDACVKQGSPQNVQHAFKVFEQMQAEGIQPTAVTYGCIMNACEAEGRVDKAMSLYQEACERGVPLTDNNVSILINICSRSDRLEEALDLVKALANSKGARFQAGALNSLARALAPQYVQRSLGLLSFIRTLGLRVHHDTCLTLITACCRASLIQQAHDLYWEVRKQGAGTTREAGSHLIMALCKAIQPLEALQIYKDMVAASQGSAAPVEEQGSQSKVVSLTIEPGAEVGDKAAPSMPCLCPTELGSACIRTDAAQDIEAVDQRMAADGGQEIAAASGREEACSLNRSGQMQDQASPSGMIAAPPANDMPALQQAPVQRLRPKPLRGLVVKLQGMQPSPSTRPDTTKRQQELAVEVPAPRTMRKKREGVIRQWRRPIFPHARAMAALVQAFACREDLDVAFELYRQLRRDSAGAAAVTLSDRYMWQSLIEACCRQRRISLALQVFDDWKAFIAEQTRGFRYMDDDAEAHLPRISNVTLAYLQACCRAQPDLEWRIYDVAAVMRQQQERRLQAALPRPPKASHHFREVVEDEEV